MTFLCFIHPIFTVVVSRLIIQNLNKASIYYVCMHGTTVGFGIPMQKKHLFFLHGKSQKNEAYSVFNFSVG